MGSSRLPGKVLMDLEGKTALEHVVRRTQRCREIDQVVVATAKLPTDDVIVRACAQMQVPVFRGSDSDVLDRFASAARAFEAEICVRITSDCPLIDPEVSGEIIRSFKQASPPLDYASNKIPQSYPRGLDTEVFTFEALERTWRQATQHYERTHVTIYMYEHPEQFRLLSVVSGVDRADWRWCVDTSEDLEFVRQVYRRLGADGLFSWQDVLALLEREPSLKEINRHVRQKAVREG
jgi:spore coat polysaccharide biosynthesis protein SpsF